MGRYVLAFCILGSNLWIQLRMENLEKKNVICFNIYTCFIVASFPQQYGPTVIYTAITVCEVLRDD